MNLAEGNEFFHVYLRLCLSRMCVRVWRWAACYDVYAVGLTRS